MEGPAVKEEKQAPQEEMQRIDKGSPRATVCVSGWRCDFGDAG